MKKKDGRSFLILGVGNILLGDEGLGVRAVEYISRRYVLPPEVTAVDGGTGALKLLSLLKNYTHVIIIDAVSSRSAPGTIYRIPAEDLPGAPRPLTTAHDIGITDLLAMARLEGMEAEVVVFGMEPAHIRPGLELSAGVASKLPRVAELVAGELKALGVELKERSGA